MKDLGLLLLRVITGGLLAGHGAQKLFGSFDGPGLEGTSGWLELMGVKPGKPWAMLAGASEFGGGLLTLLGFLNPLGTLGTTGAMEMAAAKVHWGKPIWVTSGGAELPLTNIASALAVGLIGPGKYSLDHAMHVRLPRRLILIPGLLLATVTVAIALAISNQPQPQQEESAQAQPQPTEERPEAVPAPEMGVAHDLSTREAQAEQEPERVAGAELQAGADAQHAV